MRFNLEYFLINCLFFFPLFGEEPPSLAINSEEAEYNGHEISLIGDVTVEHELGKITAKRFSILPNERNKKFSLSKLVMQEDVLIEFRTAGTLTCSQAEVDYENLNGIFLSSPEKPEVIFNYSGNPQQTNLDARLTIKGNRMQIKFAQSDPQAGSKSKPGFEELQVDERVIIDYDGHFKLSADRALYQKNKGIGTREFEGKITLNPTVDAFCEVTTLQGDSLLAETITIDTVTRQICCKKTKGSLGIRSEDGSKKMNFSADELIWDHVKQSFVLSGHVEVAQDDQLFLKTDHDLFIEYRSINGKKEIISIFIPKESELSMADKPTETFRKINCPGSFLLDHRNLKIQMECPKDAQGAVVNDRQILCDDTMGEMSADQVTIYYLQGDKGLEPAKIDLTGNVKVFNRFDGHIRESGSILQYALADRLEYLPASQDVTLMSEVGNRVLFFDKINSVQMSAPGLKIHYDKVNRKESIQGIGDVRFTFIEREFNQLKDRFRLTEKPL